MSAWWGCACGQAASVPLACACGRAYQPAELFRARAQAVFTDDEIERLVVAGFVADTAEAEALRLVSYGQPGPRATTTFTGEVDLPRVLELKDRLMLLSRTAG